jgi:hypothetical protein
LHSDRNGDCLQLKIAKAPKRRVSDARAQNIRTEAADETAIAARQSLDRPSCKILDQKAGVEAENRIYHVALPFSSA